MAGNIKEFNTMIYSALGMIIIALALFIYAYVRVSTGSGIKDVKLITLLFIISTIASLIVIGDGLFIVHAQQDYAGFSTEYIENNVHAINVSPNT